MVVVLLLAFGYRTLRDEPIEETELREVIESVRTEFDGTSSRDIAPLFDSAAAGDSGALEAFTRLENDREPHSVVRLPDTQLYQARYTAVSSQSYCVLVTWTGESFAITTRLTSCNAVDGSG